MGFVERVLGSPRPDSVDGLDLPRRVASYPSPGTWRDEVVYFLLVDRFSDGREAERPLLDRRDLAAARPPSPDGQPWRWDRWAASGGERFQGGTLRGVTSKLDYLRDLGVTTVWISPVFRQRGHLDTYHGYGVQDFLDVDPRFGDRRDAVELVAEAHARGMRVLFDVIVNHTGSNWVYPPGTPGGQRKPHYTQGRYPFGAWLDADGREVPAVAGPDDGVWPRELQDPDAYVRAGRGDLGRGSLEDPGAEFRRSDFEDLRELDLDAPGVLSSLARCCKHWIALTDCDGFRLDTVKHVTFEQARSFCGTVTEFAANLGKRNFLLLGEVAGGDWVADRYLRAVGRNLDAALDIGEARIALREVARGQRPAVEWFAGFGPGASPLGSHRELGDTHVSVLDDHDHVFGEKLRFATGAGSDTAVVAGVALQLFTLGIPCLYYGTEQGFAGPEPSEWPWLPGWGGSDDRYLREAMFGPRFPRRSGRAGVPAQGRDPDDLLDPGLPGFGPFGTAGAHCFDPGSPAYRRIAELTRARRAFPVLREGRQYLRELSVLGEPLALPAAGELVAWSRVLDDEEALCVVNPHRSAARGADVVVDVALSPAGSALTVVANTAETGAGIPGAHPLGSELLVRPHPSGAAVVAVRDVRPGEVLVLVNRP